MQIKTLMLDTFKVAGLHRELREQRGKGEEQLWASGCILLAQSGHVPSEWLRPCGSIAGQWFKLGQRNYEGHEQLQILLTLYFHNWGTELVF